MKKILVLILCSLLLVACSEVEEKQELVNDNSQVIGGYHFEGYESYKAEILEDDEGCKFMVITQPEGQNVSERAVFDVEFLGGCEF